MLTIPEYISDQFNNTLRHRAIPESFYGHYRKWLRYFLDFSQKYTPPASKSEQVRLFIEKLKSKNQTPQQCSQAAHAISLYFESQRIKDYVPPRSDNVQKTPDFPASAPPKAEKKNNPIKGINKPPSMLSTTIAEPGPTFGSSGGKRYNEWRSLEKSKSPAWDQAIEKLAATQNQAFNALLFLFRHVLKRDYGDMSDVPVQKGQNICRSFLPGRKLILY